MDLIPITKLKISKEKWLNTNIQYEDNYKIQNVLEMMSEKTYSWIKSKNDIGECKSLLVENKNRL